MRAFHPRQALLFLLGLFALRWIAHFALFSDGMAVAQLAALDLGALVVLILSALLGPGVGKQFGSIMAYFLIVGLAIAGIGYLADLGGSRHVSRMGGFIAILGAGAGLCLATKTWNQAIWIMGLLAVAGGTYGLLQLQQALDAVLISAPYVVASVVFVVTGATQHTNPTAER